MTLARPALAPQQAADDGRPAPARQLAEVVRPALAPQQAADGGRPAEAARFLRTVRHLRPRQIVHQALHRFRPLGAAPPLPAGPPARPAPCQPWTGDLPPPMAIEQPGLGQGVLTFQNRPVELGFPPDWNRADLPAHWLYHLHCHDWLWELPCEQASRVATDWMARYAPGRDRVGWDPYPTSLRLANWCALFLRRHRAATLAEPAFRDALWASVHRQAEHLSRNLEWRLLGNHLLENAAALALAGSCFDHADADRWFQAGRRLLARELREQMLADGGHVERSPMYQCRVLWVLLLLRDAGPPALRELVQPYLVTAADALAALTHPDGGIALLNDSALGAYPAPADLVRAAGAEPAADGPFALAETGCYGARTAAGDYVVCDAGPLGPDWQPGHGHADLFSFELASRGARVVVDSGVSTYEQGAARDWCRSTRAHNTVEVGGCDSAEMWAAFRVGRRCRPREVRWTADADGFELSGRHDGYRHLPGRPVHERTFRWRSGSGLDIVDRVVASRPVRSVARLHFHPDCRLGDPRDGACSVRFPGGRARLSWSGWEAVAEEDSLYCPEFGVERPNPCLAFSSAAADMRASLRIRADEAGGRRFAPRSPPKPAGTPAYPAWGGEDG